MESPTRRDYESDFDGEIEMRMGTGGYDFRGDRRRACGRGFMPRNYGEHILVENEFGDYAQNS